MSTEQDRAPGEEAGSLDEAGASQPGEPTEEELRAADETEVKKLRVEQLVLENVVTLANLGMRRTGLAPGTENERDPEQVRLAIEAIRALLPLLEQAAPQQVGAIRDALSQLQLAFVRVGGQTQAPAGPEGGSTEGSGGERVETAPPPTDNPDEPGPAQRSGRLRVP